MEFPFQNLLYLISLSHWVKFEIFVHNDWAKIMSLSLRETKKLDLRPHLSLMECVVEFISYDQVEMLHMPHKTCFLWNAS